MNATTIEQLVQQFKSTILERIRHNILQSYTDKPSLEDEQLFFLLLPQLNGEQWSPSVMTGAITTGIVHTALNEHERILAKGTISKEQQLIVLAGDYYSGRYYQLLAQAGNIQLIQKLSAAIIERNEHEIKAYEHTERSLMEWINSLAVIKTALIERFYAVFGFETYTEVMKQALIIVSLQQLLADQTVPFKAQLIQADNAWLEAEVQERKAQLVSMLKDANYAEEVKQQILAIVSVRVGKERF